MKLPPFEPSQPLPSIFVRAGKVKDAEGGLVIMGCMVMYIHATRSIPANPGTTIPGKVYHIPGGVARNVAECMSKLGTKPYMISAMGLDMADAWWDIAELNHGNLDIHVSGWQEGLKLLPMTRGNIELIQVHHYRRRAVSVVEFIEKTL